MVHLLVRTLAGLQVRVLRMAGLVVGLGVMRRLTNLVVTRSASLRMRRTTQTTLKRTACTHPWRRG